MTRQEFDIESCRSVELAKDICRNQLAWLDYVQEGEFTPTECNKLLDKLFSLASYVKQLNEKYVD